MNPPVRFSLLTCPACGTAELLEMPTDACTYFHPCAGCAALLRPDPGDCCVFCSFGSVPCPPMQVAGPDDHGGCRADACGPPTSP